jgi:lipid-binding SYLF domain-containing protein
VVVRKLQDGSWSAPAFLNITGASFGAQIGGQKIDYILVVRNDSGLKGLLEDKFEMGGEASVAAGPVGRAAAASTNAKLTAGILTYSRTQGLFAGVSLKGAIISQDNDMNMSIYSKSAKGLLIDSVTPWSAAPEELQEFPKTVAEYAR